MPTTKKLKDLDAPTLRIVTDCDGLVTVRNRTTPGGDYILCEFQSLFDDDPAPSSVLLRIDQVRALAAAAGIK